MEISRDQFEKLKEHPFFKGVVVTDSMEPLIMVGDKVVVEVGQRDIRRFDIIIFFRQGKLICHYLWAVNRVFQPILFQTRSLKYGEKDLPVSFDDYFGKVVSHRLPLKDKIRIVLSKIFRSK